MASILDRYGIKEVADVTFYEINKDTGERDKPVLYLDTLKVSTIEQTAETADARGGKGNPKLITWDYGKEITVTLEDALFSAKSLNVMFGRQGASLEAMAGQDITRTTVIRVTGSGTNVTSDSFVADVYDAEAGSARKNVWMANTVPTGKTGVAYKDSGITITQLTTENGAQITFTDIVTSWDNLLKSYIGQKIFITYTVKATTRTITVSGDSFPGTYYITGDTYARSDVTGKDQFFQFIIPKAKVTSENTITLEAEGDPSVFSMNLTVLRPESGEMMQLVQYDLDAITAAG